MEEANKDQGADRLPFFFLLIFFVHSIASATTFGPILLTQQIQNADILVRGKIVGSSWVEMERTVNRPYTYWRLDITETLKGTPPTNISIRQPGGELGEMGYHVAGTAKFSPDEDVFVYLRETSENGVYEVIGLASGKLTVEKTGRLKTGLGVDLQQDNTYLTAESYRALAKRVVQNAVTSEDQKVYTNRTTRHDEKTPLDKQNFNRNTPLNTNTYTDSHTHELTLKENTQDAQESLPMAEKVRGSSIFWWLLLGSIFVIPTAIFLIRKL
ncbi:MAG: hypothetical protein M9962_14495 [Oligoflexia bacterium]|nr:hypothetical protein [Oligoflexia bacterium]